MGFLARTKQVLAPRQDGSGGMWDNTNSGGASVGPSLRTMPPTNSIGVNSVNANMPGPNVEPYLRSNFRADPGRLHMQRDILQPRIPVTDPRSSLYNTVYDDPQQARSTSQPQNLPINLGMPGVLFAPSQVRQRENLYDAGDFRTLQRFTFSHTPSQVYFDQREPISEYTTPSHPTHSVYTNQAQLKRGWYQAQVPEPGERHNVIGTSPAYQLSRPINSKTMNTSSMNGHRAPISNAKAPKRVRSGG